MSCPGYATKCEYTARSLQKENSMSSESEQKIKLEHLMLWWASILRPSHPMTHQVHLVHPKLKPFHHQVQPSTGLHQLTLVADQLLVTLLKRESLALNGIVSTITQLQILTMSFLDLEKEPVMNLEFLPVMRLDQVNHPDHLSQSLLEFRNSLQVPLKDSMLTESQEILSASHGGHQEMMVVLKSRATNSVQAQQGNRIF